MTPRPLPPRVLFVAYAFPPVGGAGVQRVTKFAKYLPDCGWQVSVLTVSNPSVPVADTTLESDVPAGTLVRRARTLEPSYTMKELVSATGGRGQAGARFARRIATTVARRLATGILQPDPQLLWLPAAVREGRRLLADIPHAAIVATGPPFSSFLIGSLLQRSSGLPLVLDYRDEWGLTNQFHENKKYGRLAIRFNRALERAVTRRASAIVATSEASARALEDSREARASKAPVVCLRNGFDPEDFEHVEPPNEPSCRRFRVVYTGTLWAHTSVEPLVEAVRRVCLERPDLGARLELVFAGRRTPAQEALLGRLAGLGVRLVTHPYLDHGSVIRLMRSADLLCSLTTDAPGAERFLNAKIFEYMAARRPILAIAPPGDLWRVLDAYPASSRFTPADVTAIAGCLIGNVSRFAAGSIEPPVVWDGRQYDRRQQAGELSALLSKVAGLPESSARLALKVCPA
jgi:glycosyltransferase involved in cell wall biosynthesis